MSKETNNGEKRLMAMALRWGGRLALMVLLGWASWLSYNIMYLRESAAIQRTEMRILKRDVRGLATKLDLLLLKEIGHAASRRPDYVRDGGIAGVDSQPARLHVAAGNQGATEIRQTVFPD